MYNKYWWLQPFNVSGNLFLRFANLFIALTVRNNTRHFIRRIGRTPNYIKPVGLNEKMQWRKIFDRNPLFPIFCDKLLIRDYASQKAPDIDLPKLLWHGDDADAIPFTSFKQAYVIKPNHRSGNILFINNPNDIDPQAVQQKCESWLSRKYGGLGAQWGYSQVKPQILIEEKLLPGKHQQSLANYKFFVYAGKIHIIQVESTYNNSYCLTFLDPEGQRLPIRKWTKRDPAKIPGADPVYKRPECFDKMIQLALQLAGDIDHIRIDLYEIDGRILLSELTPYDGSGLSYFYPESEMFTQRPSETLRYEHDAFWQLPKLRLRDKLSALATIHK